MTKLMKILLRIGKSSNIDSPYGKIKSTYTVENAEIELKEAIRELLPLKRKLDYPSARGFNEAVIEIEQKIKELIDE